MLTMTDQGFHQGFSHVRSMHRTWTGRPEPQQEDEEECEDSQPLSPDGTQSASSIGRTGRSVHHGLAHKRAQAYDDYVAMYWSKYSEREAPNLLKHDNLHIVDNGGLPEVEKLRVKYPKAVYMVLVALLNFALIAHTDIAALTGLGPSIRYTNQDFLLSKWLLSLILADSEHRHIESFFGGNMDKVVPLLELLYMFFFFGSFVACILLALVSPRIFAQHGDMHRWNFVSHAFWDCYPHLVSCSALRLLHWVSPAVVSTDAYIVALHAYEILSKSDTWKHYLKAAMSLWSFTVVRLCAFTIGFDTFLVKFRLASSAVDGGCTDYLSKLAAATFVWQVMSIIQVDWFVRHRLFIFMFGGKNGDLDVDEQALRDVWKGLIAKKVYATFGVWKGTVVMLAFDDYDMQFLVLEDDEDVERFKSKRKQSILFNLAGGLLQPVSRSSAEEVAMSSTKTIG